jgi:hypothetical protein|tara:strand:+ start:3122 stop:3436 length:315 start_codon:yes stop_codon:yes gene_type:complete
MNQEQKDKTLSSIIALITLALVMYLLSISEVFNIQEGRTLKELFAFVMAQYLDFVLIAYIFICFQLAGFVELRYKKDFITVSILSVLLTPISILFIIQNDNDEE